MTKGQITSKLIEDIASVAAYKGAVILITKNHRNQAHACTIKKAKTCTPYSTKWILLNSENSSPITLDSDRDWHMLSGRIISIHLGDIWQENAAHADLRSADPAVPFDPLKYEAQTIISIKNKDAQALNPRAFSTCRRDLVQVLQKSHSNKTNQTKLITQKHIYTLNVRGLYKSRLDIQ